MSTFARRAVLKLIGGAAIAVPRASAIAPALLGKAELAAAAATVAGPDLLVDVPGVKRLGIPIWRMLNDLVQDLDNERWDPMCKDGVDPDLACLKSTSYAWKVARQRQRNRERQAILRRAHALLEGRLP